LDQILSLKALEVKEVIKEFHQLQLQEFLVIIDLLLSFRRLFLVETRHQDLEVKLSWYS